MRFLSTIAAVLLASSAVAKGGDDFDFTTSVNITVDGSMQKKNGTFELNTGLSGFTSADGRIPKPADKADESFKSVKDMWRDLRFNVKSDRVEVRSKLANHSDYRFIVSTEGGHPRIRAFLHNDDDDVDASFLSTYMVHFLRVVEVNDTISANASTSFITLNKLKSSNSNFDKAWSPFNVSSLSINGTTVFTANTTFSDPAKSGFNFTLSTFLSQSAANMTDAAGVFKPNALKYSVSMIGFPFKYQNSHLVLVQNIWTNNIHVNTSSNSTLVVGSPTNQLSWNATVSVRHNRTASFFGANISANASVPMSNNADDTTQPDSNDSAEGETPKMVVYHFLATNLTSASELVWDPEVAVAIDASYYQVQDGSSTSLSSGSARGLGIRRIFGAFIGLVLCYIFLV